MSDQVTMTPEDIAALREERDRLVEERDGERRAREDESRRADGLLGQVVNRDRSLAGAHVQSLEAKENQADAAAAAITTEMAGYRKQLADLNAEGKFEEAAEVQEKMADAAARRNQAQQAKVYFGQQKEQAKTAPVDPVERFLANSTTPFNEAEQAWIRKNPRYATDDAFHKRVNAAHLAAQDGGVAPGSTEYFQKLEEAGYMRQPPAQTRQTGGTAAVVDPPGDGDDGPYSGAAHETDADGDHAVQTTPRQPPARSAVAAGPSRRTPTPAQRSPSGDITKLSPDEAAAALGMSEYFPEEVQNEGEAGIYAHYQKLKTSPMAKRLKSEWAGV